MKAIPKAPADMVAQDLVDWGMVDPIDRQAVARLVAEALDRDREIAPPDEDATLP